MGLGGRGGPDLGWRGSRSPRSFPTLLGLPRVAEQKEERQPPGQEENGEDPYAGSTDENTDHEGPPESPDLPVPELPGRNPSSRCGVCPVTCLR